MWRIIAAAVRLAGPHLLAPWRSPVLRWRMETYGVLDAAGRPMTAQAITAKDFFRFAGSNRLALWRFLRWAAVLEQVA